MSCKLFPLFDLMLGFLLMILLFTSCYAINGDTLIQVNRQSLPLKAFVNMTRTESSHCIIVKCGDWGFGSQVINLLHFLTHFHYSNVFWDFSDSPYSCCSALQSSESLRLLYYNATIDKCINNGWNVFFESMQHAPDIDSITMIAPPNIGDIDNRYALFDFKNLFQPQSPKVERCYMWEMVRVNDYNEQYWLPENCNQLCSSLEKVWNLSNEMRHIVDYELERLKLYPKPIIAFQLRGGDKIRYGETVPYDFEDGVMRIAEDSYFHNGTCIIIGDDSNLSDQIRPLLQNELFCTVIDRIEPYRAHIQDSFNKEAVNQRCLRTKQVLVDIEILASSDISMGLIGSNVYRIAGLLQKCRTGKLGAMFLDWHHQNVAREICDPTVRFIDETELAKISRKRRHSKTKIST